MSTYTNINDFQTFSSPLPFQHFVGDYGTTVTGVQVTPNQTAEQCEAICNNMPTCELWKRTLAGSCSTFTPSGAKQSGIKINRATRFMAGSSVYSVSIPSTTAAIGPTGSSNVPTVEDCENLCDSIASCGAYSFDTANNNFCEIYPSLPGTGNVGVSRDMFTESSTYILISDTSVRFSTRTQFVLTGSVSADLTSETLAVSVNGTVVGTFLASSYVSTGRTVTLPTTTSLDTDYVIQVLLNSDRNIMSNRVTVRVVYSIGTSFTVTPVETGTTTLTTQNRTRVVINQPVGSVNILPSDTFNVTLVSGVFTKSLGNMTLSSMTSGIDIGSKCIGGSNYQIRLTLGASAQTLTSSVFSILYRLNGTASTSTRGVYATTIYANYSGAIFSISDNGTKAITCNAFGDYIVVGTTTVLGDLTGKPVTVWTSQIGTSHLTNSTIATAPILAKKAGEDYYYVKFDGTRFLSLPVVVLSGTSVDITLSTRIKEFTPQTGSKHSTILGAGSLTTIRGGLWFYIDSTNKYCMHMGTNTTGMSTPDTNSIVSNRGLVSGGDNLITWKLDYTAATASTPVTFVPSVNTSTTFTRSGAGIEPNSYVSVGTTGRVGISNYPSTSFAGFNGGIDMLFVYAKLLNAAETTVVERPL